MAHSRAGHRTSPAAPARGARSQRRRGAGGLAARDPAWAAAAVPRRFGASLLVGWAGGGLAIFIFHAVILDRLRAEGIFEVGSELIVVFGLILLALLVVAAALLVRADPTSQAEHATRG